MPAHSVMIYGARCALRIEPTVTRGSVRSGREIPGAHTVTLHAARENTGGGEGGTRYNWDRSATLEIQVGKREITDVMAVLCKWLPQADFQYHGPARNKSYRLERIDTQVVLTMRSANQGQFIFHLPGALRMEMLGLCFQQWQRQQGGLRADTLFHLLEAAYR